MFKPVILDTLHNYSRSLFIKDVLAGIIVGVVALPLAIAFAIASGVSPEKGLFTAVIAGFVISAFGGSRVQIGGPTGAFIVIVYGIVQTYGINGLIIATLLAGVLLMIMGFARMGMVIKFIPQPLITGFTSAIAVVIFTSQIKDFLGLRMGAVSADFIEKWVQYFQHINSINVYALLVAIATVAVILFWPGISSKIPGSLVAIVVTTAIVQLFKLPVETIGSRFGHISPAFPAPSLPHIDLATARQLIQPAFTIALLGGIESLLSAVVADGMTGTSHKSNVELVAQGGANVLSALFGGIPATGAIARTATNVKNGGRTPVAGIVHAITLLIIILFASKWAQYIPMATLAGILVTVAYNMSEWQHFIATLRGPKGDATVMLTTFLLTLLVDLTVAIEIGMVLAAFLFMRKMIQISGVNLMPKDADETTNLDTDTVQYKIPKKVEVFEISGPLFFGAAYKFKEAMKFIEKPPGVLIIRMSRVPIIDATGINILKEVHKMCLQQGTKLILAEVNSSQILEALKNARLLFAIGKANVTKTFEDALQRADRVERDKQKAGTILAKSD
ncbi:SulP family inorganic anion transporter [Danxiaibacter flavus]|uniref:SulP family inorganic anion transporter n=1 Tax=Danxiaibacter flavus TaxID=3049108 RepID=A0ABV3ZHM9_9BACT|nr:SulP family inorganic anion transporter [Chitinophagaceae bacterium DXS]